MKTCFLGETIIDWKTHKDFCHYTPAGWALEYIEKYGGIDGEHHKAWVIDQVTRILKGGEIEVKVATFTDYPPEFRFEVIASQEYWKYRQEVKDDGYFYDEGIAP